MKLLHFLISLHFVAKLYLLMDIKKIVDKYNFSGLLLDVGCGVKPYRTLFRNISKYQGIDFKNYSKNKEYKSMMPDFYFREDFRNTLTLPFKDDTFDNVVSFQVLEHSKDPFRQISEMVRITKKKGYILVTAPFIWSIHEEPNDYFRFTKYAFEEIFSKNGCRLLEIRKHGSIASTISILVNNYLIEIANKQRLLYMTSIILYPVCLGFSYISLMLDVIFRSDTIFLNYIILVQKK